MPIANCKRCGRIYNRIRRDICPGCVAQQDQWFQVIKVYLHDHRDATLTEISDATEIDVSSIIDMIRDGRLLLTDHPNVYYECERCGEQTQSGRYCASCSKELTEELSKAGRDLHTKREWSQKGFYSK